MTNSIEISSCAPVVGTIRPPGSKSITNRALVCAALAEGESVLTGALVSEDTRVMIESLRRLGISVDVENDGSRLRVQGCGGKIPAGAAELFVENSGTTIRFLTALSTLAHGRFRLDGIERMRQRPIGDLADALNQLGAKITCESSGACPPVVVEARGLAGGKVSIAGNISSQYLSGLLMAAPLADGDVTITVAGELVSQPYVRMTLEVMSAFGVKATDGDLTQIVVPGRQTYQGRKYAIEPDASAASYFWAAAAVTGGTVTVQGLTFEALQGDVRFCDCLRQMGCQVERSANGIKVTAGKLRGVEVNMNAISDTVQTLAVVALFADGPTTIRDVAHIRHKETDRIGDLATELVKLGAEVEEFSDGLRIIPGDLHGATIDTYNDHRMAMSLALAGLVIDGVVINDPECTGKTYPDYFADLDRLCHRPQ